MKSMLRARVGTLKLMCLGGAESFGKVLPNPVSRGFWFSVQGLGLDILQHPMSMSSSELQ